MNLSTTLPTLLCIAWLLPLASFVMIVFFGKHMGSHGKGASYLACGAIITSFVLSLIALGPWPLSRMGIGWLSQHQLEAPHHETEGEGTAATTETGDTCRTSPKAPPDHPNTMASGTR